MDKIRAAASELAVRAVYSWPVMTLLRQSGSRWRADQERERGQGLAEYSLILALIAIVAIASLVILGGGITGMFWKPINDEFGAILRDVLGIG